MVHIWFIYGSYLIMVYLSVIKRDKTWMKLMVWFIWKNMVYYEMHIKCIIIKFKMYSLGVIL